MTYHELWEKHLAPFQEKAAKYSKETLLQAYVVRVFAAGVALATEATAETRLQTAIQAAMKDLKACAKTARSVGQVKRLRRLCARIDRSMLQGADCTTCAHWRERKAKKKGTRIPGGVGKCTRPEGHCRPSKVRGGVGSQPPSVPASSGERSEP